MWQSYKQFCRNRGQEIAQAFSRFGFILPALKASYSCVLWVFGTVFYGFLGCFLVGASLIWWLVRVVAYLVQLVIAKIRAVESPSFPKPWKKRVRNMTGVDFGHYVADKLRARGYYDVRFTPATGDYGVDILATKRGKVYAFQCKCYTGSVGVSAVQEVFSGSRKYQADKAVVITNSHYTPNARTLAGDLGVSLWDLAVLDSIFCE